MTAAPLSMVAIRMSWPGQSTKDTCLSSGRRPGRAATPSLRKGAHGCEVGTARPGRAGGCTRALTGSTYRISFMRLPH